MSKVNLKLRPSVQCDTSLVHFQYTSAQALRPPRIHVFKHEQVILRHLIRRGGHPGAPWWCKRELATDICYWFFVPLITRVLRIGLRVIGAAAVFNIHDADELIAFYDNGHGPLAGLLLWVQAAIFLIVSDFMLYWLHRMYHGGGFWKYHAIHHFSENLDWISAARFHLVNLFLNLFPGTVAVDVTLLMAGRSPSIMLWGWPIHYGVDDQASFPSEIAGQLAFPFRQQTAGFLSSLCTSFTNYRQICHVGRRFRCVSL